MTAKPIKSLELLYIVIHFLIILFIPISDPPECSSYAKLNTADRAAGRPRGNILKCDRNDFPSVAKWYRFEGDAGTRIPSSPVPVHHCGTHATGWLNGQHPSKEDGSVRRQVCFNWSGKHCRWSINVHVRNCGAFYVYHLGRTPGCSFRYCGNKGHSKFLYMLTLFTKVAFD